MDVTRAPLDAGPRRGESRRRKHHRIDASHLAEAHPNANAGADCYPDAHTDSNAEAHANTQTHANTDAQAHANPDADSGTNTDAAPDTHPHANAYAYADTYSNSHADPIKRSSDGDGRVEPARSPNFWCDCLFESGRPYHDDKWEWCLLLPNRGAWHLHSDHQRSPLHDDFADHQGDCG
jgi:hypothetical protein